MGLVPSHCDPRPVTSLCVTWDTWKSVEAPGHGGAWPEAACLELPWRCFQPERSLQAHGPAHAYNSAHGPAHCSRPRPRLFLCQEWGAGLRWHFLILNEVVLGDTRVLGVSSHFITSDSFSRAFNPLRYRLKTVFSVAFAMGTFYFDVVKSTNLSLVVSGCTASVGCLLHPRVIFTQSSFIEA